LALREAIEAYPEDLRVALVASGGLSHFVTDEALDRRTLEALRAGDARALCDLPAHLLNSGNSEVRNWIVVAAACQGMQLAWDDYIPVYRTAAGTGCGLTFARWAA
jgi:3-O-methylgallate 3,4-dioxygenase